MDTYKTRLENNKIIKKITLEKILYLLKLYLDIWEFSCNIAGKSYFLKFPYYSAGNYEFFKFANFPDIFFSRIHFLSAFSIETFLHTRLNILQFQKPIIGIISFSCSQLRPKNGKIRHLPVHTRQNVITIQWYYPTLTESTNYNAFNITEQRISHSVSNVENLRPSSFLHSLKTCHQYLFTEPFKGW